jgi:hypothetical protein
MRIIRIALPAIGFPSLITRVVFLRYPGFGHLMWNVNDLIHAAISRLLHDGGPCSIGPAITSTADRKSTLGIVSAVAATASNQTSSS